MSNPHCWHLIIDSYLLQSKEINLQIYLGGQNNPHLWRRVLTLGFGHQTVNRGSNLGLKKYYRRLLPSKMQEHGLRLWNMKNHRCSNSLATRKLLLVDSCQPLSWISCINKPRLATRLMLARICCLIVHGSLSWVCPSIAQQSTVLLTLYDRNDVYFVLYSDVPIDSSNMIVVPIIVLATEYEPLISKPSARCLPAFSKSVNWVYFYEMLHSPISLLHVGKVIVSYPSLRSHHTINAYCLMSRW